jgi:hypothetical protein
VEETLVESQAKLLIVDSVASVARKDFDSNFVAKRQGFTSCYLIPFLIINSFPTELLAKQASTLKYLSETFTIPIVVTNQVSCFMILNSLIYLH